MALPQEGIELRRAIARRLAQRLKDLPLAERSRPLSVALAELRELARATPAETRKAWRGVDDLVERGLVRLEYDRRSDPNAEPWYRKPKAFACEGSFEGLAELGDVALPSAFGTQLAAALEAKGAFTPEIRAWLAERWLTELEGFGPEGAADRLIALEATAVMAPELFLREASARAFGGLSKVLDGRSDWVSQLLGRACPFAETPISLLVATPLEAPRQVVFVENLTTFERLRLERYRLPDHVFIYSSGFKGAAARAALGGRTLFADGELAPGTRQTIEATLSGSAGGLPIAFYGDLDYSGMSILASLKQTYPTIVAWQPGYAALLDQLEAGCSHAPSDADKTLQADPGRTGCAYADEVLLPALRRLGRFVDQEAVHVRER